jgi:tetratricopeptide (TPR) repeat protein
VPYADPSFDDQAIMLELIDAVVPEIVSVFSETDEIETKLSPVLARLVVYHSPIARMVVELGRPYLPDETFRAWVGALRREDAARFGALLTAELLSRPIRPGAMEATFQEVRDEGRALAATLIDRDPGPRARLDTPRSSIVVVPFSREALIREAWSQYGRGARFFARGDLTTARHHLELAARLNSDQPVLLWNLARVASARGDREDAVMRLDQAILAAERTGATSYLGDLRNDLSAAQSRSGLPASLVSPISQAGRGRH